MPEETLPLIFWPRYQGIHSSDQLNSLHCNGLIWCLLRNLDHIVSKSFDLAIRLGKLEDSSLIAKKLNDVKLYLCCSRDYAEKLGEISSINDLSGAKFIIVEGFELRQSIINKYFSALKIAEDKMVLTTNDTRVHLDSV